MRSLFAVLATLVIAAEAVAMDPGPLLRATPSQWATTDGVRVHYKVVGKGKTSLVFIHGLGGEMGVWREQVAYFAPKAKVLVLDLPGFGQSDKPDRKYSMRFFARAIRAVMDDAKIDRAVLIGHSMGAPVIREFDRMFPTRTKGLVVVDGALVNNLPAEAVEKFVGPMRGPDYVQKVEAMFDSMTDHASPSLRTELKSAAAATPQQVLVSSMEQMFDPSIWKDDKISIPLLVVNTGSPFWTAKYIDTVRAMARDFRYITVEDADHFLMLEQPAALNKAMDEWMKKKGWR